MANTLSDTYARAEFTEDELARVLIMRRALSRAGYRTLSGGEANPQRGFLMGRDGDHIYLDPRMVIDLGAGDDAPRRVPLTQAVVEMAYTLARVHNGGLGPNWIWQLDVVC